MLVIRFRSAASSTMVNALSPGSNTEVVNRQGMYFESGARERRYKLLLVKLSSKHRVNSVSVEA